ncbi:hypothetical protein [Azotosporobacter soli]|uniref:hypothetical protein n=1 Tax=Azotosporobacter soli TaxID=3055040 RepID=UPI0031FEFBE1
MKGKIREIIGDGYERCINIIFNTSECNDFWFYFLDEREYAENGEENSRFIVGQDIDIEIKVVFVNRYTVVSESEVLGISQPIKNSSHSKITAQVMKIIDSWSTVCDIGLKEDVLVEFEAKIGSIEVGQKICFTGELKIAFEEN